MTNVQLKTFAEFQQNTLLTDQNTLDGVAGLRLPLLGLYGEVGSLLSALKKKLRDGHAYEGYTDNIIEEFGDVLWYLSNLATRSSIDLTFLVDKVTGNRESLPDNRTFESRTFSSAATDSAEYLKNALGSFESRLIVLAGAVGQLLEDVGRGAEVDRCSMQEHLIKILKALVKAAEESGVSLQDAASRNITKTQSRWPRARIYPDLFDEDDVADEQLPRFVELDFLERCTKTTAFVRLQCNGINIGDRLTDNKAGRDDYRFHDVFHLAYASILGWSPVTRTLFKVKRKSRSDTDENQDGARAALVEEGISTWIFSHASRLKYFEGIRQLDYPLLKAIGEQTRGYEVERCPLWLWEKAILDGYKVFRQLRHHRRGIVIADMRQRQMSFRLSA
jgi:NTP pyrophosphatase (non-canonical NTP hydrolase)